MATTSEDSGSSTVGIEKRLGRIEQQLEGVAAMAAVQRSNGPFGYQSQLDTDEIDLRELWNVVWTGKWTIIAITAVFAVASVIYALSQPNIYKAQVLLAPSEESQGGGMAALAGKFGGLASLAGVSLGEGGSDKTVIAIEVMKSRQFINAFIEKYELLVPLMAAEGWIMDDDKLILDEDIYSEKNQKWVRNVRPPKKAEPTLLEAHEIFMDLLSISQDKKTSLITVAVENYSPGQAKEWTENLVKEINAYMRERDVTEATKSIQYLTDKLKSTPVADMRMVFSQMIEEQTKVMMLAEVRNEYVFSTLDPAVVPEEKVKPKRALICVLGVILGGVAGLMYLFVRLFLVGASGKSG